MNCRKFERDVADWISGRLPPEGARRMALHAQECVSCALAVQAETCLRDAWRQTRRETRARNDLWPGLAPRIGKRPSREQVCRGRLAWAGAVGMAAVIAITVSGPFPWRTRAQTPADTPPFAVASPRAAPAPWPVLPGASQVEPSVDDPGGASMDEVWTQLNADAAPVGS